MTNSARNKHEYHARMAERWRRGAEGEEATAAALAALPSSWVVIHDVAWPGRKLANIDHVVIGTAGVFVIDSKNWSGQVTVEHGELRQNRRSRVATLRNAVAAAEAVAALIPEIDAELVRPVLCFSGDVSVDRADGVLICSTYNLVPMMASRQAVVSDQTVRAIAASLRGLLTSATDGRRARNENLAMGAPVTLAAPRAMPRATPRRRKSRSSTGKSAGMAASAAAAVALAVVITNGLTNSASDQPPPGDQQIQPQDKKDKKKNSERKDKKSEREKQSR